ncbi:hypothetical protein BLOT_004799 [Blomia tropicalis]|nr:hypothetical protein BLOT_004799 [Blomia tropicalis]
MNEYKRDQKTEDFKRHLLYRICTKVVLVTFAIAAASDDVFDVRFESSVDYAAAGCIVFGVATKE